MAISEHEHIKPYVENIVNKPKEFECDYETLKTLQILEERQHKEKAQFTELLHELRVEYNNKRSDLESNIQAKRYEVTRDLEEAKINVQRAQLELERVQMIMDHLLDSKTKLLEDLSKEFEERERKILEEYEDYKAITLKEIQKIENPED